MFETAFFLDDVSTIEQGRARVNGTLNKAVDSGKRSRQIVFVARPEGWKGDTLCVGVQAINLGYLGITTRSEIDELWVSLSRRDHHLECVFKLRWLVGLPYDGSAFRKLLAPQPDKPALDTTRERQEEVARLHGHMTLQAIADGLGTSLATVKRDVKKLGLSKSGE